MINNCLLLKKKGPSAIKAHAKLLYYKLKAFEFH